MWVSYSTHLIDTFDTWNSVGWLLLALMLYGVWRLWRGMRPDGFERGLRALREGRRTTVAFPRSRSRQAVENRQAGPTRQRLQVSLLPMMLISCAAAMLLAQAQRPDDVSRPATWALFIVVGTWYGSRAWPHWRGVGPLRNHALAGVLSGAGVSVVLWGFYLAVDLSWGQVDLSWGQTSFTRVNASLPSLLWWTAVGGAIGAGLGAVRAGRIYGGTRAQQIAEAPALDAAPAIEPAPRRRRVQWGVIGMACAASLLFHCSAAPHLYRQVDVRYWTWNWYWHNYDHPGPSMTLTMAPAPVPDSLLIDDQSLLIDSYDPAGDEQLMQEAQAELNSTSTQLDALGADWQMGLVPRRPIRSGEKITISMVKATLLPVHGQISGLLRESEVLGRFAHEPLAQGRPIRQGQVASLAASSNLVASGQTVPVIDDLVDSMEPGGDLAAIDSPTTEPGYGGIKPRLPEAIAQVEAYRTKMAAEKAAEEPTDRVVIAGLEGYGLPGNVGVTGNPLDPSTRYETRPGSAGASPPVAQTGGSSVDDLFGAPPRDPVAAPRRTEAPLVGDIRAARASFDGPFASPPRQPPPPPANAPASGMAPGMAGREVRAPARNTDPFAPQPAPEAGPDPFSPAPNPPPSSVSPADSAEGNANATDDPFAATPQPKTRPSPREDLSVRIERPAQAEVGSTVMYKIFVTNSGNLTLIGLRITDRYSASMTPVIATTGFVAVPVPGANELRWTADKLKPGERLMFQVQYRCGRPGTKVVNNVRVSGAVEGLGEPRGKSVLAGIKIVPRGDAPSGE